MNKAYQFDERKAINRFRSYLTTNPGDIQLVLPLAELAQRLRHGVSQMLFDTELELATAGARGRQLSPSWAATDCSGWMTRCNAAFWIA